jgi:hypothetical protein
LDTIGSLATTSRSRMPTGIWYRTTTSGARR